MIGYLCFFVLMLDESFYKLVMWYGLKYMDFIYFCVFIGYVLFMFVGRLVVVVMFFVNYDLKFWREK